MNPATFISLRPATIADLSLLRYWDEQPHVLESDPNDDWDWEAELLHQPEWRLQLIAQLGERPIGFVQIIDPALEETHYWGDAPPGLRAIDIWIGEESDLGKGYGSEMMRQALRLCFEDPDVTAVLIDPLASNRRAHAFYERLGFRFVEQRILGDADDECYIYRLDRQVWEESVPTSQ